MKIKKFKLVALVFLLASFVFSFGFVLAADDLIALQGNVRQSGVNLGTGDLQVVIWDAYSGGNVIYNSTECGYQEPECGDGNLDAGEECDDGNNANGDGCDKYCKTEGCPDTDHDCVCDQDDKCLNSRQGEMVNEEGCDPFQFCGQLSCGDGCSKLDFIPKYLNCEEIQGEPEGKYPGDCTIVIVHKEGIPEPRCTPTTCAD